MLELFGSAPGQFVVQFGITVEGHADIGVGDAHEGGRISAVAAFHIAVIVRGLLEEVFNDLVLGLLPGQHHLVSLAFGRGKPQAELQAVESGVLLVKWKQAVITCVSVAGRSCW